MNKFELGQPVRLEDLTWDEAVTIFGEEFIKEYYKVCRDSLVYGTSALKVSKVDKEKGEITFERVNPEDM